jgi:large subunit ribosomal protein L11
MSGKLILRTVCLYVKSGEASITPPIGPLLSQHSIDVKQFCTLFNNDTKNYEKGIILKVILYIYTDNTFSFSIKSSPLFFLFELSSKVLQIPNNYKNKKGILLKDIYIISLIKNSEYKLTNIKILFKIILNEAKKMGYKIIEQMCSNFY